MNEMTKAKISMIQQHNAQVELEIFGHTQNKAFLESMGADTTQEDAALQVCNARLAFNHAELEKLNNESEG